MLSTTGGTSDARFIQAYCPVVEFGLVGQTMHAVDERTPVEDLERLAAIYRRRARSLFRLTAPQLMLHRTKFTLPMNPDES